MATQLEINNIIADSGNFINTLQLNGTGVSIIGHTHTSLNSLSPGSVSSPSISSSGDLSTGIYFPSSGSISIASSGYDRFKIDSNGNAAVGGQNINSLRYLDINNLNNSLGAGSILRLITTNVSGTGNISVDIAKYKNGTFIINNNETDSSASTSFGVGGSERLRITSSGNVGIGTVVPTSKLHVVGDMRATSGNFTSSLQVNGTEVSISGHNHTSSDITNFNSSVSGLLPVTNIVAGTGMIVSSSSGSFTINSTGGGNSSVVAGSGIFVTSVGSEYTVNLDAYSILIGNGSATSFTVTHNLGATNDVHVSVRETATNYYVYPDIKYVDSNSVLIEFVSAPTSNQYRVSIIGF
jgi:hypothetical protein